MKKWMNQFIYQNMILRNNKEKMIDFVTTESKEFSVECELCGISLNTDTVIIMIGKQKAYDYFYKTCLNNNTNIHMKDVKDFNLDMKIVKIK